MWCFGNPLDFTRPYLFHSNSELGDLGLLGKIGRFRIQSIHIMLESKGGYGTTQKFIFLALFMPSLLQNVPRAIR